MRYARKHTYDVIGEGGAPSTEVRLIDVVDVSTPLPAWANSPTEFLARLYPNVDVSEFVEVPGDAAAGALDNGDGTFTNPPRPSLDPPLSWDAYDFKLRFTTAERIAVRTRAKADPIAEDFMDMLDTAAATGTRIFATDALVIAGLGYLEDESVIASGRAAAILSS